MGPILRDPIPSYSYQQSVNLGINPFLWKSDWNTRTEERCIPSQSLQLFDYTLAVQNLTKTILLFEEIEDLLG